MLRTEGGGFRCRQYYARGDGKEYNIIGCKRSTEVANKR